MIRIRLIHDVELANGKLARAGEYDADLQVGGESNGLYTIRIDGEDVDFLPKEVEVIQLRRTWRYNSTSED